MEQEHFGSMGSGIRGGESWRMHSMYLLQPYNFLGNFYGLDQLGCQLNDRVDSQMKKESAAGKRRERILLSSVPRYFLRECDPNRLPSSSLRWPQCKCSD